MIGPPSDLGTRINQCTPTLTLPTSLLPQIHALAHKYTHARPPFTDTHTQARMHLTAEKRIDEEGPVVVPCAVTWFLQRGYVVDGECVFCAIHQDRFSNSNLCEEGDQEL
jgi:hypothetical protein